MKKLFFCLYLIVVLLECAPRYSAKQTRFIDYRIAQTDSIAADAKMDQIIDPYRKKLQAQMSEVIGEAAIEMIKAQPESGLGNWIADMMHAESEKNLGKKIDFAISNHGGTRLPVVSAGPINVGKIFELLPFDNYLTVVYISKDQVQKIFDHMAQKGGWPVSKSVKYFINNNQGKEITINGKPLEDRTYAMATNDYIASGGDNCEFLATVPRWESGVVIRDAMVDYVRAATKQGKKIEAKNEGRVSVVVE